MTNSVPDNIGPAQPKILVLGATGATGRLIVGQAVARGYDVTMLVRSAEKARRAGVASDWRLETWAADLLLTCKVGQPFDDSRDREVRYFLERRSGPIGAALAASITLPDG